MVCHCYCHCCQKMFHGLAGRQTLDGFGVLLVLNDGLWLIGCLELMLECSGFFIYFVAGGWLFSCVTKEGALGVKIRPMAREKRLEVAVICEFLVVSAVSSCILSPSEGISGFPGLRVAGAIPGIFSGKSDNLWVRTAKEALCLEGTCGFVRSYLISLLGYTPGSVWSWDGD